MNAASPITSPRRGMITLVVMLATIMQAIDTTIANVALPHMQGTMGVFQDQIAWVLTSYIVATAIFLPLTGFLAARFGRRQLFIWSVVGFTITSMMCGAAQDIYQIVLFRFLQGMFGAPLVPLSQTIMLDIYPKEKHGSAMALWGMGVMLGPIIGPSLGGYLTEYYSWRSVFYINLPVGIVTLIGLLIYVPDYPANKSKRFDLLGFAFLAISIAALQMMLDRGESLNWFAHPEIVIEAGVAALFFYLFLAHLLTASNPFIDPRLFKDRNFNAGMIFMFFIGVLLLAVMALLPPFMQGLMGYPILDVGLLLAPRGAGTMLSMLVVGRIISRVNPRLVVLSGLLLIAWSLYDMALFTNQVGNMDIIISGFVQGVGLGCIFVPLSTLTFATLSVELRMEATPLYNLVRNLGSSIGVSIMFTMLAQNAQKNHDALGDYFTMFNLPLQQMVERGVFDLSSDADLLRLNLMLNEQSLLLAYLQDFRVLMWLTLACIPLLLLLKQPKAMPAATLS